MFRAAGGRRGIVGLSPLQAAAGDSTELEDTLVLAAEGEPFRPARTVGQASNRRESFTQAMGAVIS
jgi:hypothetical protein